MPLLTGRKIYNNKVGLYAFWLSNIGMLGMTVALAVAGIAQVYLERKYGMDFLAVQKEIEIHFVVMLICATMFATGIGLYIANFIKYGGPVGQVTEEGDNYFEEAVA